MGQTRFWLQGCHTPAFCDNITFSQQALQAIAIEDRAAYVSAFLQISLQLEQLKSLWAQVVLDLQLDTPEEYQRFLKLYDSLVATPIVHHLRQVELKVHRE